MAAEIVVKLVPGPLLASTIQVVASADEERQAISTSAEKTCRRFLKTMFCMTLPSRGEPRNRTSLLPWASGSRRPHEPAVASCHDRAGENASSADPFFGFAGANVAEPSVPKKPPVAPKFLGASVCFPCRALAPS